jgi:hypothetical protein
MKHEGVPGLAVSCLINQAAVVAAALSELLECEVGCSVLVL